MYAKAISFGQAPNATYKDVSHGIENFSQLVSYTGMMGGANLIEASGVDNIQINASNIRITTNTDVSANYVYLNNRLRRGANNRLRRDIETVLSGVAMPYTEASYAIAQTEAYQGQITVEDDGQPEPEPEPEYVTYAELAKAIREGVNAV